MSEPSAAPAGWHTITPRIAVSDARGLVDFLTQVFAAVGAYEDGRPSIVRIGDSVVMISEVGSRDFMPAFLYVYVGDTDATYARAVQAGAKMIEEPFDTPYGDRRCMFRDGWGNTWQVASQASDKGSA